MLKSIQSAPEGTTLLELLARHPTLARRTAQRWIGQWISSGQIVAQGEGRARRYLPASGPTAATRAAFAATSTVFPADIPLSADSQDILAYVTQPLQARKPVGYQRGYLDT